MKQKREENYHTRSEGGCAGVITPDLKEGVQRSYHTRSEGGCAGVQCDDMNV